MKSRSLPLYLVFFCSSIFTSIHQVQCDEIVEWDEPNNKSTFYTAGVLEYSSPTNATEPETIVALNLIEYIKWVERAASQGIDILVFPEATLNYNGEIINSVENMMQISQTIISIRHLIPRGSFTCGR